MNVIPVTPRSHEDKPKLTSEFIFRLKTAKPSDFWNSVRTARVREKIHSQKNGDYSTHAAFVNDVVSISVLHPVLLPYGKSLEIIRFELFPIGDGLKVITQYSDFEAYNSYLMGLFREISKDWKEVAQELNSIIKPTMTLAKLAELEQKADAGDKDALEILDRMAQEEGHDTWKDLNDAYYNSPEYLESVKRNEELMAKIIENDHLWREVTQFNQSEQIEQPERGQGMRTPPGLLKAGQAEIINLPRTTGPYQPGPYSVAEVPQILKVASEIIAGIAGAELQAETAQASTETPELLKWKTIVPNKGDDWQILELWENNHTNSEIGERFSKRPRTITNRISALRLRYPSAGISTNDERRKRLKKS